MSERINLPAHGDRADLIGELGKATRGHVVKEGAVGRKRCRSGRGDWAHCRCSPRILALSTMMTDHRSVVKAGEIYSRGEIYSLSRTILYTASVSVAQCATSFSISAAARSAKTRSSSAGALM